MKPERQCSGAHHITTQIFIRIRIRHNFFTSFFPGQPGWAGARRVLLDFMVQGKINRGRHTDHPAGRHSVWNNQCPPPPSPPFFYRPDALPAAQPTASKHWRQLVHSGYVFIMCNSYVLQSTDDWCYILRQLQWVSAFMQLHLTAIKFSTADESYSSTTAELLALFAQLPERHHITVMGNKQLIASIN